ncbi:hypothetical protein Tco_0650097 [Tanacetum coccineum]
MSQTPRQIKRGRDTKIPQSSGPPKKVGDEAVHKELGDRMERAATNTSSLKAEHNSEQFWKTASASTLENGNMEITTTIDGKVKVVSEASIRRHLKLEDSDGISTFPTSEIGNMKRASKGYTRVDTPLFQTMLVQEEVATMPHDSPLPRVHSLGSDEGSMTLNELTVLCTTLSKKVETLESDLKQTKLTYGAAYTKLIMKVKKLEHKGRKITQVDEDEGITLVPVCVQTRGKHEHDFEESDFEFIAPEEDYTAEPDISTANVPVITAGEEVSTTRPEVKTTAKSLVYIRRSTEKRKDKGKAIMKESEPVQKKTKLQLEQERLGLEEALRLQEQLDEEERKRIARVHEEASTFNAEEWDNIQAQIEADEELAHRYMHDPLKWRLYDTCAVYHVSTERGHDIFMLIKKDYPLTRALITLMLSNKLQVDEYSVMADELLRKIFILANRPRQNECDGGHEIYGINELDETKYWFFLNNYKRKEMKGNGVSFLNFLIIGYGSCQVEDSVWSKRYSEWCNENSHDKKHRPRDYTFKGWVKLKKGHLDISKSVRKDLFRLWVIDKSTEALDPDEDPFGRCLDEYN